MPSASNVAEVEAITQHLDGSVAALLTEYRGLKVSELATLRTTLRGSGTDYRVLKNTLAGLAARNQGHDGLVDLLQGPTAIAFVHGDFVQAAKDLSSFAREHPALVIKGGLVEGRVIDADGVRNLATLQPREVLLARVAGLLAGPLQQAVTLLAAPAGRMARLAAALREHRAETSEDVPGSAQETPAQDSPAQDSTAQEPVDNPSAIESSEASA